MQRSSRVDYDAIAPLYDSQRGGYEYGVPSFRTIALRGHAQVDIGIFGMGFARTPGADL